MEDDSIDRRGIHCRNCENERIQEKMKEAWLLVTNLETTGDVLDDFAHRAPRLIAERVAEHPNAHASTLERLSYHPCGEVRAAVAQNCNTPTHIFFALIHDSNPDVRYSIAENHNSPTEALVLLTEDENPYVAYRAQSTLQRLGPQQQAQQLAFPSVVSSQNKNQKQQAG